MTSTEIRKKYLEFFESKGHKIVPGNSLIPPEDDKSSLFVSAGVQPLAAYILGKLHPSGKRIVNIQKCVRVQDIDEVGDNTHDTFFEMMGNWSFGDYFKEDAIKWSYELLTSKTGKGGMGLDPQRLYITVFGGNQDAPKDIESFEIWKKVGIPENRIYFMTFNGKKEPNWWEVGDNGPCGPDTEIFYDITEHGIGDMTKEEYVKAEKEQQVVEIWNNVFMEYEKRNGEIIGKLKNQSVDTGAGLERWCMALQKKENIFDTDLFLPSILKIRALSSNRDTKAERIVADHIRTAVFMIADGVNPSNTGRGYILRRLIRRAVRYADKLGMQTGETNLDHVANEFVRYYNSTYNYLNEKIPTIFDEIKKEEKKFRKTLDKGLKEFEKGTDAFTLFSTYGFPLELTLELAKEGGREVSVKDFEEKFRKHQEISKAGLEQKFKGGLGGTGEMEIKYHTATHLLRRALEIVLGEPIMQKGSNITPERLRFDFGFGRKLTDEEKQKVEDLVNQKISENLPVTKIVMKKEEAEKTGAVHTFGEKYGDEVSIYIIGPNPSNPSGFPFSQEFCGGPHVTNTSDLASGADPERLAKDKIFKIIKEEAVSAGVRRIKAILE